MNNQVIIFRTHLINQDIINFAHHLASVGLTIIFAVDETQKILSVPYPFKKISLTKEKIDNLQLYCPSDVGWRCGDYNLYVGLDFIKDYEYVWLIEHDVRINAELKFFFEYFNDYDEDFIGAFFEKCSTPGWDWYERIKPYFIPYRCFFPISRFSNKAIPYLFSERQKMSIDFFDNPENKRYPNDESFVASVIGNSQHLSANHFNFGEIKWTDPLLFTLSWVFPLSLFASMPYDYKIYHKVASGGKFFEEARRALLRCQKTNQYNTSLELTKYLEKYASLECNAEQVSELLKMGNNISTTQNT